MTGECDHDEHVMILNSVECSNANPVPNHGKLLDPLLAQIPDLINDRRRLLDLLIFMLCGTISWNKSTATTGFSLLSLALVFHFVPFQSHRWRSLIGSNHLQTSDDVSLPLT